VLCVRDIAVLKDRDLDRTGHIPDLGELLIRHHHMFGKTGTSRGGGGYNQGSFVYFAKA